MTIEERIKNEAARAEELAKSSGLSGLSGHNNPAVPMCGASAIVAALDRLTAAVDRRNDLEAQRALADARRFRETEE